MTCPTMKSKGTSTVIFGGTCPLGCAFSHGEIRSRPIATREAKAADCMSLSSLVVCQIFGAGLEGFSNGRRDPPAGRVRKNVAECLLFRSDLNVFAIFRFVFRHEGLFHFGLGNAPTGMMIPDFD